MAEIKLTKNELRDQQTHLAQLEKYLPTLQLKKAMLQAEVHEARAAAERLKGEFEAKKTQVEGFCELLSTRLHIDPLQAAQVEKIHTHTENIAGVEIPIFDGIDFKEFSYTLFETPLWVDAAIAELRALATLRAEFTVAKEQCAALEKEWREVSIRVNLFEKILIPRALENIKTIKIFLGDQQLAAVSRAKVAKAKIGAKTAAMQNKEMLEEERLDTETTSKVGFGQRENSRD